jgi:hypothetical protein
MAVWMTIQCHDGVFDVEVEQKDHWSSSSRLNQWQWKVATSKLMRKLTY